MISEKSVILKNISLNVKHFRKMREMSQEKLADLVGVTQTFISQLESQQKSPSWATLRKIAQALDVHERDLLLISTCDKSGPESKIYEWLAILDENNLKKLGKFIEILMESEKVNTHLHQALDATLEAAHADLLKKQDKTTQK